MTLTIELTPQQEEALRAEASAAGLDAAEYARWRLSSEQNALTEEEETALPAMLEDIKETGAKIIAHLDKINADTIEMIAMLREAR